MINYALRWSAYVALLRQEHLRLGRCVRNIEKRWEALRAAPIPPAAVSHMLDELHTLRAELARHFEQEESGGCLEEAVSAQPQLSREVTRLEREHKELLAQMDEVILSVVAQARLGDSLRRSEDLFRSLAERLRAHEACETRILEECSGICME